MNKHVLSRTRGGVNSHDDIAVMNYMDAAAARAAGSVEQSFAMDIEELRNEIDSLRNEVDELRSRKTRTRVVGRLPNYQGPPRTRTVDPKDDGDPRTWSNDRLVEECCWHSAAEWYAACDRVEDAAHYRRKYVRDGCGTAKAAAYAANFARQLNKQFGDEPVDVFVIDIQSMRRFEFRPREAKPGSGVFGWNWRDELPSELHAQSLRRQRRLANA